MVAGLALLLGATSAGQAQPRLRVRGDTHLQALTEATASGIAVSGTLLDDLDQPLGERPVRIAIEVEGSRSTQEHTVRSATDGTFRFSTALPAGRYRVVLRFADEPLYAGSEEALWADASPSSEQNPAAAPQNRQSDTAPTLRFAWALLPLLLSLGAWWLTSRNSQQAQATARGRASPSLPGQSSSLRDAALLAYKPAALHMLASPTHWGQLTLRETLQGALASGKATPAFAALTAQTEQATYAPSEPTRAEVEAIGQAAKAILSRGTAK